nr:hypothetical protein Iba_chr13cCG16580 [Ipomoea batatas]
MESGCGQWLDSERCKRTMLELLNPAGWDLRHQNKIKLSSGQQNLTEKIEVFQIPMKSMKFYDCFTFLAHQILSPKPTELPMFSLGYPEDSFQGKMKLDAWHCCLHKKTAGMFCFERKEGPFNARKDFEMAVA